MKDISIYDRKPISRYWLMYNYGNGHADIIMWSDNFQRLFEKWLERNCDCFIYENGKTPYGLACNISGF